MYKRQFLDYGDRSDIFRTGPDSVFNQAAVAATAYLDAGLYSQANLSALANVATYTPTASKTALVSTYNVATGSTLETYGTAQLDLSIDNKSSAAFGQVTIPMAERWNITLGARYTYDKKGMRYETKSNSVGVPHSLVLPDCTPTTVNIDGTSGCSAFVPGVDATLYTAATYGGQAAVIAGAFAAAPELALAPGWDAACTFDNTNTIGTTAWAASNAALIASTSCNTNFEIIANAQGVGIAPIASSQQLFVLNQDKYKDSQILITGKNFGCGSSREHAPWSILDYGIKCIIASSFADIFYNNCFKNGILPIKLDESEVTKLQKAAENSLSFTIDLENQKISYFDKNINHEVSFELDKAKKTSLLEGLDDIGLTLAKVNHISDFENKQKSRTPWLYSQQIK